MQNNYIPNIDLSEIISKDLNSDAAKQIAKSIKEASEDIGFFTVTNHGIPISKINNLLKTCKKFFYLPEEDKLKIAPKKWNPNTNTVYRGYFPSSVNGKEGLDIGDPLLKQNMADLLKKEKFELNHDMTFLDPSWQATINNYFDDLHNLGMIIFKTIISSFSSNLSIADRAFQRPKTLSTLRFNYYPKQDKPVEVSSQDGVALGCETHVDSGIMTILYQDKKGGLQVQNRHSLQWYDVPHDPNAFVINTGLALEYFTNGRMKATNHRVLFNQEERISIPFFFEPSYDFILDPKYLDINENLIYNIDNYEDFLTNSLKKFVEYDRPA
ncbi:isopenicillin N synthase family oxygenase [Alphaproteobacteria bacterium]|nr:isopenicillin N synthase family oxygenase [Alphaproteobacteria bacterium]